MTVQFHHVFLSTSCVPRNVLGTWEEPGIKMIVIHEVLALKELIVLRGKRLLYQGGHKSRFTVGSTETQLILICCCIYFL